MASTVVALLTFMTVAAAPVPKVAAPSKALVQYNTERLARGRDAMIALTTWGAANTVAGAIGWPLSAEEEWQAFHGMNLAWGTVNLAIALPSLIHHLNGDPRKMSFADTLRSEESLKATLMLNIGLDVAYLTAGVLMWERGEFGNDALLLGFGRSLMLQGAFLLVFDVVYYVTSATRTATLYARVREGGAEVGWFGRF